MATENAAKTQKFKAEVTRVLSLVINSLYSNKEVFLRELISNAADALDKLRFEGIGKPELLPKDHQATIRLIPDAEAGTLTIWDSGIGMNATALAKNLGTVAHSGSKEFIEKLQQAQKENDLQLIGQFGVGFYSAYLVADRVEVVSLQAGAKKANRWSSDGRESFTVEPAERDSVGTSITLHLGDDHKEYLEEFRLREVVRRYSDFISYPIELQVERETESGEGDDKEKSKEKRFEAINQASALWTRSEKEIEDAQYEEFYKHLTHDWEPPLSRSHFKVEGTQMFTGLLFLPKRPPFDLSDPETKHGVRLYVRRVFIMDNCEELLPRWLRFTRGVIDSDDLPLNVSREVLQDSSIARTIRKQVIRRVLDMLDKLAKDDAEGYRDFWSKFGPVFKEGLHFDASYKDKIAPLLRYEHSSEDGLISLTEYVEKMPEGQKAIYYAIGPTRKMLAASPHLEELRKRGYDVLFMTDGVDQWAVEGLSEFKDKQLVNAMEADLDLDEKGEGEDKSENKDEDKKDSGELMPLLERASKILEDHVSEVRVSERLTDSPVCLVQPKGGLPAHLERMIRAHQQDLPVQKRILEVNAGHPVVERLRTLHSEDPASERVTEWVEMLYDQALLTEGSPLPDPARFAQRMTALMQASAG